MPLFDIMLFLPKLVLFKLGGVNGLILYCYYSLKFRAEKHPPPRPGSFLMSFEGPVPSETKYLSSMSLSIEGSSSDENPSF